MEAARCAQGHRNLGPDDAGAGAPPRFDNAALLLIDQVSRLKDGKITLSDTSVSLTGWRANSATAKRSRLR
jgi:OOP family OmpA-OmpF porin